MAKRGANGGLKVSAAAWDMALKDFNSRFDAMEKQINEIAKKIDKKVSVDAWNRGNKELEDKFKGKVSVKAWEAALIDNDKKLKDIALNELREFDDRLDRTMEAVSALTVNLKETVSVSAWNRLCESNEQLIDRVDHVSNKSDDFINRLVILEKMLREAKVSEADLKKLLESI